MTRDAFSGQTIASERVFDLELDSRDMPPDIHTYPLQRVGGRSTGVWDDKFLT